MVHGAARVCGAAHAVTRSILDHFSALENPRQQWHVVYPLPEILLPILCATLSGLDDVVEIRLWGEQRLTFLRRFLPYERGLPAHDTLNEVVNALDAELFQASVRISFSRVRSEIARRSLRVSISSDFSRLT